MDPTVMALAVLAFASTLIGGLTAVRFRKVLQYFFAFASGSLVAASLFGILPEALNISASISFPIKYLMLAAVIAFLGYSLLERYFLTLHHEDTHRTKGRILGPIGAIGLSIHSFFDGVAMGAAFQVNPHIGIIVALAVIFDDFTDGINVIIIMLKHRNHVRRAQMFLLVNALAPLLGVLVVSAITINPLALALVLAVFAGQFLYIGATNLLPETYRHDAVKMSISMTLGVLLIFIATSVV